MIKKLTLLTLIISASALAMSPVQFSQLQQQFKKALAEERIDQAQQFINQLQPAGRGAYASAWQLELNAKKEAIEKRKRDVAENLRLKEEAERKRQADQKEAQQREAQAAQDKQRREQEEARLKAEAERGASAANNEKLLAEIHAKNTQINQLNAQVNKLQSDLSAQRLNADTAALEAKGKCDAELLAASKRTEESVAATRRNYEQLLADAQKAAQLAPALEGQVQQLKVQVTQLQNELTQAQKQNEVLKQGTVTQKASEEYRLRLADAEKALQAQTKRAQDCESQKNELARQLQGSQETNKKLEAAQKTEEALRKQIEEMKKNQGTPAEQAQRSQIIQKKMDDLLAANQKYEKQIRELNAHLESSKKEIETLKTEDNNKADRIFNLETDAEAEKQLKEKAQKELASVQKEVREIVKDLKEQKEAYAALQFSGTDAVKKLKEAEAKCAAEIDRLNNLVQTGKEMVAKTEKLKKEAISKLREAIDDYVGEIRSIGSSASPETRNAIRRLDDKMTSMLRLSASY